MFRLRSCLLCVIPLCVLTLSSKLGATPPLTTISDTLFNADGTYFNGVVVISWPSFRGVGYFQRRGGDTECPDQRWSAVRPTGPHHQCGHRCRLHRSIHQFGSHAIQRGLGRGPQRFSVARARRSAGSRIGERIGARRQ